MFFSIALFLCEKEGVDFMKFDSRMFAGMIIGMLLGLHFYSDLVVFLPILMVIAIGMLLKEIRH